MALKATPAVEYTYNGSKVQDICTTPDGAQNHLGHLLHNGYADAKAVTVLYDAGNPDDRLYPVIVS
jgi:hypothetical protein